MKINISHSDTDPRYRFILLNDHGRLSEISCREVGPTSLRFKSKSDLDIVMKALHNELEACKKVQDGVVAKVLTDEDKVIYEFVFYFNAKPFVGKEIPEAMFLYPSIDPSLGMSGPTAVSSFRFASSDGCAVPTYAPPADPGYSLYGVIPKFLLCKVWQYDKF